VRAARLEIKVNGHTVAGPREAAEPFANPPRSLAVDGVDHADPVALVRRLGLADDGPGARFVDEIDNSVDNLALARSAQPAPDGGEPTLARAARSAGPARVPPRTSALWTVTHCPVLRTRTGLTTDEVLACPRHRRIVDLVPSGCPRTLAGRERAAGTAGASPAARPRARSIPHPGRHRAARPLMRYSTLALVADPADHVKTAVDVQMTSAVRIVSLAAITMDPSSPPCWPPRDRPPTTAGRAVIAESPPAHARQRGTVPESRWRCAGGCQRYRARWRCPSPCSPRPRSRPAGPSWSSLSAIREPLAWLTAMARMVLAPLACCAGIALGHGQNLLLLVRRPAGARSQDIGGVRISPVRCAHGIEAPHLRGDIARDDVPELRTKLFAAAVSTVLAELVMLARREFGVSPPRAWAGIAAAARACVADPADLRALLRDPLPLKAMTAMRLAADPLREQWVALPNPMVAAG
jgi:hypothetical protein